MSRTITRPPLDQAVVIDWMTRLLDFGGGTHDPELADPNSTMGAIATRLLNEIDEARAASDHHADRVSRAGEGRG